MKILMHCFHRGLLGVGKSKASRIAEILENKPPKEHALRLRLLQEVPLSMLPIEVIKAARLVHAATSRLDEAEKRVKLAMGTEQFLASRDELSAELGTFDKAFEAFKEACSNSSQKLEALHKRLCVKDCPWDGEQILLDSVGQRLLTS